MIIIIDAEKVFDKINHSWLKKVLNKLDIERTYGNITKDICDKPLPNIFDGEKPKAFLLRTGQRQGWSLWSLLFNILLEVLARKMVQEKKTPNKLDIKLSLYLQGIWYYI